jgi:glycosyltransferase involved in cell wall biosynthesis
MKVLVLAGASSIHTVRWANALAQANIELVLATQHEPLETLDAAIQLRRLPYSGEAGYFHNVGALKKILADEKPDLLNAHYASGYGTTARLSGFRPYLLSVWGSDVYDFPRKSPLHRWWMQRNLMAADQVASTSHVMAEQTRLIAPKLRQIAITPFGVDTANFASDGGENSTSGGPIAIGTVKTLAPKYGIDTLIDSVATLIEGLKRDRLETAGQIRLRLVGDGPQSDLLKARAHDRGIADIVEFQRRVPHRDVPDQLRRLDIYVALSRLDSESFGVAIIEAGACGLPVVVSDAGGLPEVVVAGETGFVVPRDNPAAAADALRQLVLDPDLRHRMGAAGRDHVIAHYEWKDSVNAMIALYGRVIADAKA